MKLRLLLVLATSCLQLMLGKESDDMLIVYLKGVVHYVDPGSGVVVESVNLKLDSVNERAWKLASNSSGNLFLTDLSRTRPVIYRLVKDADGNMEMVEFADGCFPLFVGNEIFYFLPADEGYRLVKSSENRSNELEEVDPGPFFPGATFQGVDSFGFYDQGKSDYYLFQAPSGLQPLKLPNQYAPVGMTKEGLFVCYSGSTSGTHYLDRSGKIVRSIEHAKPFERPLFYDGGTGLLVVNRIYGTGFLHLTEAEEPYAITDDGSVLIEVGPLSMNSVVARSSGLGVEDR